ARAWRRSKKTTTWRRGGSAPTMRATPPNATAVAAWRRRDHGASRTRGRRRPAPLLRTLARSVLRARPGRAHSLGKSGGVRRDRLLRRRAHPCETSRPPHGASAEVLSVLSRH